jgi:hypothetical protein
MKTQSIKAPWAALFAMSLFAVMCTHSALAQWVAPACDVARPSQTEIDAGNCGTPHPLAASCTATVIKKCSGGVNACGSWTVPINICNPPSQNQFCSAVHAALLNTGNALFWYITGNTPPHDTHNSYVLSNISFPHCSPNMLDCVKTEVSPPIDYDILCAGMSTGTTATDGAGTIIATGGMAADDVSGIRNTTFFKPSLGPSLGSWRAGTDSEKMVTARFYPSNVQEPSPSDYTLVIGGNDLPGHMVTNMEEWAGVAWAPKGPTLPTQTSLYPRVKLVPERSGEFVMAGENAQTFIWDPPGGTWNHRGTMMNPGNNRSQGGVVVLPLQPGVSTQIFTAGGDTKQEGAGCPTNTAEVYTLSSDGLTGSWAAPPGNRCMCYARYNLNLVLLANGTVLAVGGGNGINPTGPDYTGPIPAPELFDPVMNTWTVLAPALDTSGNPVNRTYHSTALLLPDGRVLSAGSDTFHKQHPGTNDNTFQIFSPPYMFATRPTITSVTGSSTYGSQITINTPDAGNIGKVALIRPGTTTHANDTEQRYVQLTINSQPPGQVLATLPTLPNRAMAPPGFYMLIIVNSSNIPSMSYVSPTTNLFLQLQ